jgi:hypothetical protein
MAVIGMGGPDRPPVRRTVKPTVPRVRVPKAKKPKKRKTTPGKIVYRTPRPPSRPTVIPAKSPTAMPTGPAAPKPPPTMLDRWRELGLYSEVSQYEQMKNEGRAHQAYVTDKVMPWLSNSLNLLNAYNTDAQNTMLGGIQGASGAYGVSAAMTPMNVASNAPGGAVVGPNSYLTEAGRQQALGTGNVATALANAQAALNKMQPVSLSQGYINALADKAAGLPAFYTKRSNDYAAGINQFIAESQAAAAEAAAEQAQWEAEFTEKSRHNWVSEAISATNSQTNAAIQLGRLGLDASDQAFDNQPEPPDPRVGAAPPPGYYRDVDGRLVRIPSSGASGGSGGGTSTRDARGRLKNPTSQGFVGGWKVKPKKLPAWAKGGFTQGADGKWYVKRGTTPKGSAPGKVKGYGSLVSDLSKKWNGPSGAFASGDPGWATTFRGNPNGIAEALSGWIVENASSFNTASGGKFDVNKARRTIGTLGDGQKKWVLIWPMLRKRIKNGVLV